MYKVEKAQRNGEYYMVMKKPYKYGYSAFYTRITDQRYNKLEAEEYVGDLPSVTEGELFFL